MDLASKLEFRPKVWAHQPYTNFLARYDFAELPPNWKLVKNTKVAEGALVFSIPSALAIGEAEYLPPPQMRRLTLKVFHKGDVDFTLSFILKLTGEVIQTLKFPKQLRAEEGLTREVFFDEAILDYLIIKVQGNKKGYFKIEECSEWGGLDFPYSSIHSLTDRIGIFGFNIHGYTLPHWSQKGATVIFRELPYLRGQAYWRFIGRGNVTIWLDEERFWAATVRGYVWCQKMVDKAVKELRIELVGNVGIDWFAFSFDYFYLRYLWVPGKDFKPEEAFIYTKGQVEVAIRNEVPYLVLEVPKGEGHYGRVEHFIGEAHWKSLRIWVTYYTYYIGEDGLPSAPVELLDENKTVIARLSNRGYMDVFFRRIWDVSLDYRGKLYLRAQIFSATGAPCQLTLWAIDSFHTASIWAVRKSDGGLILAGEGCFSSRFRSGVPKKDKKNLVFYGSGFQGFVGKYLYDLAFDILTKSYYFIEVNLDQYTYSVKTDTPQWFLLSSPKYLKIPDSIELILPCYIFQNGDEIYFPAKDRITNKKYLYFAKRIERADRVELEFFKRWILPDDFTASPIYLTYQGNSLIFWLGDKLMKLDDRKIEELADVSPFGGKVKPNWGINEGIILGNFLYLLRVFDDRNLLLRININDGSAKVLRFGTKARGNLIVDKNRLWLACGWSEGFHHLPSYFVTRMSYAGLISWKPTLQMLEEQPLYGKLEPLTNLVIGTLPHSTRKILSIADTLYIMDGIRIEKKVSAAFRPTYIHILQDMSFFLIKFWTHEPTWGGFHLKVDLAFYSKDAQLIWTKKNLEVASFSTKPEEEFKPNFIFALTGKSTALFLARGRERPNEFLWRKFLLFNKETGEILKELELDSSGLASISDDLVLVKPWVGREIHIYKLTQNDFLFERNLGAFSAYVYPTVRYRWTYKIKEFEMCYGFDRGGDWVSFPARLLFIHTEDYWYPPPYEERHYFCFINKKTLRAEKALLKSRMARGSWAYFEFMDELVFDGQELICRNYKTSGLEVWDIKARKLTFDYRMSPLNISGMTVKFGFGRGYDYKRGWVSFSYAFYDSGKYYLPQDVCFIKFGFADLKGLISTPVFEDLKSQLLIAPTLITSIDYGDKIIEQPILFKSDFSNSQLQNLGGKLTKFTIRKTLYPNEKSKEEQLKEWENKLAKGEEFLYEDVFITPELLIVSDLEKEPLSFEMEITGKARRKKLE